MLRWSDILIYKLNKLYISSMKDRLACMYERSMLGRCYVRHGFSNIFHISHVTILMVSMVSHNLGPSIWQLHTIFPCK